MTTSASPPTPRRTILAISIALVILLILAESGIAWLIRDDPLKTALKDWLYPVTNILATAALFWAARRSSRISNELGRAWYFFAYAQLAYCLGNISWAVIEVILKQNLSPSISDGFYLLYYPLVILGIFALPKTRILHTERLKLLLDMVIAILAASLAYWVLLIGPLLRAESEGGFLTLAISLAYPVLDMILLWTLVSLLARPLSIQQQLPIALLAVGAAIQALADSSSTYQHIAGISLSGNWLEIIRLFSYSLAGLAGVVYALDVQTDQAGAEIDETAKPRRLSLLWNLTPYLWMALSYLLLIWDHYQAQTRDFGLLAAVVFIVGALAFLHQAVSTRENTQLYHDLQREFKEHKRTTAELRENEARSRALSDLTTDYVYSARVFPDGKMKLEWASEAFAEICGYSPAELEALGGWNSIVHPEDVRIFSRRREAMEAGRAEVNEYRIINKDQQIRWLRDYGRGEVNEEGQLYRILGAAKDITENKRTELALAQSESRLKRFLNAIQAAILITDREGRPYMVNDVAHQLLAGHALSLDPPKRLAEYYRFYLAGTEQLYPADRLPMFRALWGESSKEKDIEIQKGNKRIRLTIQSIPILDSANKVEYVITTLE
jgi:PAS domain S-box-containing protein